MSTTLTAPQARLLLAIVWQTVGECQRGGHYVPRGYKPLKRLLALRYVEEGRVPDRYHATQGGRAALAALGKVRP